MDLFFLRAFLRGKLLATTNFEKALVQLRKDAERYRQVEKSAKLKEYQDLDKVVNTPAFLDKKRELTTKKYKDSDACKKLAELNKLLADKYVKKYLKTGEGEMRTAVQKYVALKAETETPEFQQLNAFWANPKRWETTTEGKQEARYQELKKDEDILFFVKADVAQIGLAEKYTLAYSDDFNWTRLADSDWQSGAVYPSDDFQKDHSFFNEKQAYNKGRNVETADSVLHIKTIRETTQAPAWDPQKGMVMKEFTFTSDMISNPKVAIEEGDIVLVRAHCRGHVNHGIYLRSPKHIPFISLFNYNGLKLYAGYKDSLKNDENLHLVDGLQPVGDIVYAVAWQKDEIVWFVNNLEIYRTKNTMPKDAKLYLHMYSFIFEKVNTRYASEGELLVDWVRVLKPVK